MKILRGFISSVSGLMVKFNRFGEGDGEYPIFPIYGLKSQPKKGSTNIYLTEGSKAIQILAGDSRYSVELKDGNVALHDDGYNEVILKSNEGMVLSSKVKIVLNCDDIKLGDGIDKLITEKILTPLKNHDHDYMNATTPSKTAPSLGLQAVINDTVTTSKVKA